MNIKPYKENYLKQIKLKDDIIELEKKLYQSELYKQIQAKKQILYTLEKEKTKWEQSIIKEMEDRWLISFETEDVSVKISYTPWILEIKDKSVIPEKYIKKEIVEKINMNELKKDIKEWLDLPNVRFKKKAKLLLKFKK